MERMALEEPAVFTACKEDSHVDLHLDLLASLQLLGGKAASCLNYCGLISWYLDILSQVCSKLRAESSTDDTNAPRLNIKFRGEPVALGLPVQDVRGGYGVRGGINLKHLYHEI